MNFKTWAAMERRAVQCINEFSRAGIKIPAGKGSPNSTVGILNWQRARALDAVETGEQRGEADQYAHDTDGEDLGHVRASLRRFLDSRRATDEDKRFARRIHDALCAYMDRSHDADRFAGRSMRDMESDGRKPFEAYEPDATPEMRQRLARDRAQARRVGDASPRRGFCGPYIIEDPNSDLAKREAQAMWSANM